MSCNRIFVTGPPGCGKTTLIKNIVEKLRVKRIPCDGFYTEEVRENGIRQGFDVVLVSDGSKYPLARISNSRSEVGGPKVGRYTVNIVSFDKSIGQIFNNQKPYPEVLIIDEIGKMELFSEYFKKIVKELYSKNPSIILASIPVQRKQLPLVEELCRLPSGELITVNVGNRDLLVDELSGRIAHLFSEIKK